MAGDRPGWLWVWFKPATAPQTVLVRVPHELWRDAGWRGRLTMRAVLQAVAIDPREVAYWSLYGATYDAQFGANPVLDMSLPEPPPNVDSTIAVFMAAMPVAAAAAMPGMAWAPAPMAAPGTVSGEASFVQMDSDWNACLVLEVQAAGAASQLNALALRINSLNRDLSPEESRLAAQQDKRDWQETRRFLRDAAARLSRVQKDQQLGITSVAGKRNWFESTYEQHVVPRRPFEGMEQAQREFELYRKTLQTLVNNMTAAIASATQDAERRAQTVLNNIAASVRTARAKRG